MKYLFCAIIVFFGCSRGADIKINNNISYYYCVTFESDGLYLFARSPMKSINEVENIKKKYLDKEFDGFDANYYKVIKENKIFKIYGYSILTNELRVFLKTDEQKHLIYERYYNTSTNKYIICNRRYILQEKTLVSEMQCDNGTSQKNRYRYRDDLKYWSLDKIEYYEGARLKNRISYNPNGTIKNQIVHNNKISEFWRSWIGSYDGCVPFKIYPK